MRSRYINYSSHSFVLFEKGSWILVEAVRRFNIFVLAEQEFILAPKKDEHEELVCLRRLARLNLPDEVH